MLITSSRDIEDKDDYRKNIHKDMAEQKREKAAVAAADKS